MRFPDVRGLWLCACVAVLLGTSGAASQLSTTIKDPVVFKTDEELPPRVESFTLGLLAPWTQSFEDFSALTSASAVSIAIERIHADPSLNTKMRFSSVVTQDSACNSKTAAGNTVKMFIDNDVDVFIGPPCSIACRPAAELASFWNKPIVSWVASDPDFNDKSIYTTLGRSLGPFNKMGVFILEILKQYNWRRVVIVSSNYFIWLDASKAITKVVRNSNVTIAYSSQFERLPPEGYIRRTLTKIKEEGRIVLLIVPKEDRRRFMLMAHDLGMTKGDYVFFTVEMLPEENVLAAEDVWSGNDGRDPDAKQAFESVFHVTLAALANAEVNEFRKEVARRMLIPPWSNFIADNIEMSDFANGDKYSPFLYDAVLLYALSINETMTEGRDARSGKEVLKSMKGKVFSGMTGAIILDDNGDREPDYWINDMAPDGTFVRIAEVVNVDKGVQIFRKSILPPRWPGGLVGHEYAPPDTPPCGFRNELCSAKAVAGWVVALAVALALCAVGAGVGLAVYLYRRQQFETQLLIQSWKVTWEDIEPLRTGDKRGGSSPTMSSTSRSLASNNQSGSAVTGGGSGSHTAVAKLAGGNESGLLASEVSKSPQSRSMPSMGTQGGGQIFSDIALYKGVVVALKHIKKEHMQINRNILLEFNEMKDIIHENLNVFVGACVDPPNICLLWHYCPKGSLQDVLNNDAIKLDNAFKFSFMRDICNGLFYLTTTRYGSHGNVKSSNCLIDARWTIKITDFGLPSFLSGQDFKENEVDAYKRKLWTSPELLRENFPPPCGTTKADVYSFAVVAYEIMMRSEPYTFDTMTPRDVVNRVRNGESIPYRPQLPDSTEMGKPLINLIKNCWDENPEQRPSFPHIRNTIRKMAGGEINIMDNVLNMMEKYAYNLEEIVEERTQQLMEEKKKTDRLLYRMLPATVAEQLKAGKFVQPENYEQATIYFSDVVGFTQLASDSSPLQIVNFLNDLYTCFDDTIAQHDVYKVETIGDAYMVVSGVPVRNGSRHSAEIANVSLGLLSAVTNFKIRHRPHQQLQLRIGLHTGPVVAGVVGNIMPRYCLFGDTVNMAARMESSGKPLRIHISKMTYIALSEYTGDYQMALRGEMSVKGKGLQTTYWLYGKKGFNDPLPTFDKAEVQKEDGQEDKSGDIPARHALMGTYDSFKTDDTSNGGMPAVV